MYVQALKGGHATFMIEQSCCTVARRTAQQHVAWLNCSSSHCDYCNRCSHANRNCCNCCCMFAEVAKLLLLLLPLQLLQYLLCAAAAGELVRWVQLVCMKQNRLPLHRLLLH